MTENTSGLRAALSWPLIYELFQFVMGARRGRQDFVDSFIRPREGCRILDWGCGTAEIYGYLPKSIEYWGFDISPKYISAANERFGKFENFNCMHSDKMDYSKLPKFDVILAIGVLHHLDDETTKDFFSRVKNLLSPDGRVLTIDPCLCTVQNPIARLLIRCDRGQNVRTAEEYTELAQQSFKTVNGILRNRRWIPYTHWIMECLV
jgi:SAM-dependent methyltransferase